MAHFRLSAEACMCFPSKLQASIPNGKEHGNYKEYRGYVGV